MGPALRATACAVLASSTAACTVSGGAAFTPHQMARSFDHAAPGATTTIGGIVTTTNWRVSAGKTLTVAKNLALFAAGSVKIDGKLIVPRGLQVAFFTPSFTIDPSGQIATAKNKAWKGQVDDLVSACQIQIQDNAKWDVGAGDNLAFTSSGKPNPKRPCTIYVGAARGGGYTGSITLEAGVQGGTDKKRSLGQNGGWIEVGTPQAISVTQALAAKDKHGTLRAYSPDIVDLNSQLAAGNGGEGKSDDIGTLGGNTYTFTAHDGGIGGSVQIVAGEVTGVPEIYAGNGGNGGHLAQVLYCAGSYTCRLDGTSGAPNGLSAVLTMGSGGGGGEVAVKAKTPASIVERSGDGGNPSALPPTGSGNAYPPGFFDGKLPTFTSNGGSFTLYLALPGKRGPRGNNRPTKPKNGSYSRIFITGGNGSSNLNQYGSSVQGGMGGDLTIVPPKHVNISTLRGYGLSIAVSYFGSGDKSSLLCPAAGQPSLTGLNGGNAGALHDNGLMPYVTVSGYPPTANSSSFNGGNGSQGTPPGNGGQAGTNDEGAAIGHPGTPGAAC
jgi:hypothetical protein